MHGASHICAVQGTVLHGRIVPDSKLQYLLKSNPNPVKKFRQPEVKSEPDMRSDPQLETVSNPK